MLAQSMTSVRPWRRGKVGIASASEIEDPGSNPARVSYFWEKRSNAVVYNLLSMHCMCIEKREL
jgi:hypothetical protein